MNLPEKKKTRQEKNCINYSSRGKKRRENLFAGARGTYHVEKGRGEKS